MPLYSDHITNMYYSGTPSYSVPYSYTSSVLPLGSSYSASYLNPGGNYSKHSSLAGYSRTPSSSRWVTSSGRNYAPILGTISERGTSSPVRISSPRRVSIPKRSYASSYTPRPININTADIDVSRNKYHHKADSPPRVASSPKRETPSPVKENGPFMPRVDGKPETGIDSSPGNQRSTIKRGRTVVRLHTVKRKDRDSPRKPQEVTKANQDAADVEEKVDEDTVQNEPTESIGWREKLSEDLTYKDKRQKKTLGAKLVEKFIVKDKDNDIVKDKSKELIKKEEETKTLPVSPLSISKPTLNRSPDRRCSVEMLAEQANLLDSLIRGENLSTATLDLSKVGVSDQSKDTIEPSQFVKRRKSNDSLLQTTKSDHSLHESLKSFKDYKDPKHFSKRRSLRKSASGGSIRRLDSITEFPREIIQSDLPAIEENRLSVKRNSDNDKPKPKLKTKITSSVEVSEPAPKSPLKFRVENVTVEEKPRITKKEITFFAEVDNEIQRDSTPSIETITSSPLKSNMRHNKNCILVPEIGEPESPEPEDGNFWNKIGKRETVYLIKRKQYIEDNREQHRRALFWFPAEEEPDTNNDTEINKVVVSGNNVLQEHKEIEYFVKENTDLDEKSSLNLDETDIQAEDCTLMTKISQYSENSEKLITQAVDEQSGTIIIPEPNKADMKIASKVTENIMTQKGSEIKKASKKPKCTDKICSEVNKSILEATPIETNVPKSKGNKILETYDSEQNRKDSDKDKEKWSHLKPEKITNTKMSDNKILESKKDINESKHACEQSPTDSDKIQTDENVGIVATQSTEYNYTIKSTSDRIPSDTNVDTVATQSTEYNYSTKPEDKAIKTKAPIDVGTKIMEEKTNNNSNKEKNKPKKSLSPKQPLSKDKFYESKIPEIGVNNQMQEKNIPEQIYKPKKPNEKTASNLNSSCSENYLENKPVDNVILSVNKSEIAEEIAQDQFPKSSDEVKKTINDLTAMLEDTDINKSSIGLSTSNKDELYESSASELSPKDETKKESLQEFVDPTDILQKDEQVCTNVSRTNETVNQDATSSNVPEIPIVIESVNIPNQDNESTTEPLVQDLDKGEDKKAENVSLKEEKLKVPKQWSSRGLIKKSSSPRRPVKEEPALRPLIATPRPLQKKSPQVIHSSSSSESSSDEDSSDDDDADESDNSEDSAEFFECENNPDGRTSTGSNDSGFDSSAPTSPAGFVQIKKGGDSPGTSSGTAPALNDATDVLEQELEQSTAYGLFRKTGRFTPPARTIPRFRKYTIEDFNFIKVLGKGSFGKVLLAELRDTEYYYAVKCLKKDVVLEDDDVECTLIERKVLALGTNHPYLCHLFATFQTDSHLFFVMEYLNGGDLMFHIQQSGRFPEARSRFYAAEIVSGLKFLHKRGIVYRDLKLDNILLDFDGHVRIADFGMCKLQIYLDKTADTFCGTPDYMAPEIIKGLKYNQAVDWWSFGVLLYEMLIGQSPFSGCDEDELFWSICNEMPSYPRFLSPEALAILTRLLDKDARTRLGGAECMHGDVREQTFFHSIHWDRLERRDLEAPFKPRVRHPMDTQYFDKAFTGERPRLTAVEPQVLRSMDQEPFRGFSYTNPNATDH